MKYVQLFALVACVGLSWELCAEDSVAQVNASTQESVMIEKNEEQGTGVRKQTLSSYVTSFKNLVWGVGTFGQHYIRRLLVIFGPVVTYCLLRRGKEDNGSVSPSGQQASSEQQHSSRQQEVNAHNAAVHQAGEMLVDVLKVCQEYDATFKQHMVTEADRARQRCEAVLALREEMRSKIDAGKQALVALKNRYAEYENILARERDLYNVAVALMQKQQSGSRSAIFAEIQSCAMSRIQMWPRDAISLSRERDRLGAQLDQVKQGQSSLVQMEHETYDMMQNLMNRRVERAIMRYGDSGAAVQLHDPRLLSKARMHAYDVEYKKQRAMTLKAMQEELDVRADALEQMRVLALEEEEIIHKKELGECEILNLKRILAAP